MSATHHYAQDAEELQYGFLAARAKEAIAKSLTTAHLSEHDHEILNEAADFLNSISEGAKFVDTKELHGHRANESLTALTLALNPLNTLQSLVTSENQGIAEFFCDLATSIRSTASDQPVTEDDRRRLRFSIDIFNAIYQSLRTSLSENRRFRSKQEYHSYT